MKLCLLLGVTVFTVLASVAGMKDISSILDSLKHVKSEKFTFHSRITKQLHEKRTTGDSCTTLTTQNGIISSPNYPHGYANNLDQCWKIEGAVNDEVFVSFLDFRFEDHRICSYDWVQVHGGDVDETLATKYCGETNPGTLSSGPGSNVLFIRLHTDFSVTRAGFSLAFNMNGAPAPVPDPSCTVITNNGIIKSPNFPSDYANRDKVCWIIEADAIDVDVEFTTFIVENHPTCRYDKVTIMEGVNAQGVLIGDYCTTPPPKITVEDGEFLYIVFTTDGSVTYKGFEGTVGSGTSTGGNSGGNSAGSSNAECGEADISPDLSQTPDQTNRIIGGDDAISNSWPWQISLRLYAGSFHTCGGSILDENWVITAAHCVDSGVPASFKVVAGDHDVDNVDNEEQMVNVAEIIIHPQWNPSTIRNDVALLRLATPFTFNDKVNKVCLPTLEEVLPGDYCWATGWGWVEGNQAGNNQFLQQVSLPIISNSQCRGYNGYSNVQTNMLCAGRHIGYGGCKGDSGGPLVCQLNKDSGNQVFTLHGLTSWGHVPCAQSDHPTVYTRVTEFLPWIQTNTGL